MAITYQTSGSTPVETATSSWSFTYDAIETKDPTTLYLVTE